MDFRDPKIEGLKLLLDDATSNLRRTCRSECESRSAATIACSEYHQRQAIFNAPYLIEMCSLNYNMRWENEWRITQMTNLN